MVSNDRNLDPASLGFRSESSEDKSAWEKLKKKVTYSATHSMQSGLMSGISEIEKEYGNYVLIKSDSGK